MPTCPHCRHHFRVLEDEDDGQHACPRCGYTGRGEDDLDNPESDPDADPDDQ